MKYSFVKSRDHIQKFKESGCQGLALSIMKMNTAFPHSRTEIYCVTELWKAKKVLSFGAFVCSLTAPLQKGMLSSTFFYLVLGR